MLNSINKLHNKSYSQLILGRFFSGIAGGAICFNIPIYVGEIASKEVRGFLLTLYQVFVKIGVVFVYTLGSLVDLFTLNIVCTLLLLVYTTYFMFLPESPVMLIRQNKTEEAEKSIKLLRGSTFNAQPEIMEFKRVFDEASKAPKNSFFNEIRKRETWRALVLILCIFFFFHMSGINAVIVYSTLIFIETGITMEPSTATIILGIVQVIATLSASMLVDRFGRKFLLAISFVMMIVGLVGIGSFFCLKDANIFETKAIDWIPLPSLCIFVIGFSSGLGPVPFVLLGEIFSTDAKRVIAPFAQTMSFAMSFIIGLIFPSLVSLIGAGFTFFMFATFCFLGLLFTIFILPETKGKSLIEIQMLLRS